MLAQFAERSWSIQNNSNIFAHRCASVKRKVKSTFAAELEAVVRGIAMAIRTKVLASQIFNCDPPVRLFTDNRS